MYIDNAFNEIKNELTRGVENLTPDNFNDFQTWATSHLDILRKLSELKNVSTPLSDTEDSNSENEEVEVKADSIKAGKINLGSAEKVTTIYTPIGELFTFAKLASGGVIQGINYPIPEELVKAMELENGNKVLIEGIKGFFDNGSPIYEFSVEDRTAIENNNLKEVEGAIVKSANDKLFIDETSNGVIKDSNDYPVCLYINARDEKKFGVEEGDIVKGRYYLNNIPNSFRVTHKYEMHEKGFLSNIKKEDLSEPLEKEDDPLNILAEVDKKIFSKKRILLIGLADKVTDFETFINKSENIDLFHLLGNEHKQRIRSQISKSDLVLISTKDTDHDLSYYVSTVCNKYDIQFVSTSSDNFKDIMLDAEKVLTNTPKPVSV